MAAPFLLASRARHYLPTLRGRLGGHRGDVVRRALWLHAVSVGEVRVAAALARRLDLSLPLLVTTVTPTGQAEARRLFAGRAVVAYLPVDLRFAVRRFLDRFEPRACVLVEGDYWPLLLAEMARRGIAVGVANGRVGDRSFARLSRLRSWVGPFFGSVRRFAVQSERDRDRLTSLGVGSERLAVTGNLKFDAEVPAPDPGLSERIRRLAAGRAVLVAGSTMPEEEEQVLEAFRAVGADRALLVLAPRHPERWDAVERLLREGGVHVVRRSTEDASGDPPQVLLLDTLGELAGLYALADAAFVGGTLVATGGHNPIEPAAQGTPLAVGPNMQNFADVAERFDLENAWIRVDDAAALGEAWQRWLDAPDEATRQSDRASQLVSANRGAVERTLEFLAPILAEVARDAA
ncbi:MAG: 3-deoxy-D-manno-octulosonic acid transferase [Thermoanaerobaculia bacterium]